jgi:tight adherence protein B
MSDAELWLIGALAFGAVLLSIQGAYWYFSFTRREKKAINRRLALSQTLSTPGEVLDALRRERGLGGAAGIQFLAGLEKLVLQTGMRIELVRLAAILLALAAGLFALFSWTLGWLIVDLLLSSGLALFGVYVALHWVRQRRLLRFGEQLPDTIDVIVRGLRAGHPFRVALGLVAKEMPDPIGSEFGIFADEIAFGLDLSTAADNLVNRVGHDDLAFLAIAVNIQSQTGGNLAEILSRLARLIRSRAKMRLKIRALTSEGRLSAIFLSAAPFILFALISLISPRYFGDIRNHPIVIPATIVGFLLLGIGNFIMYRMVHFKV